MSTSKVYPVEFVSADCHHGNPCILHRDKAIAHTISIVGFDFRAPFHVGPIRLAVTIYCCIIFTLTMVCAALTLFFSLPEDFTDIDIQIICFVVVMDYLLINSSLIAMFSSNHKEVAVWRPTTCDWTNLSRPN